MHIFTSSISVYEEHLPPVDESSDPKPYSPYGQSKLEAERIHRLWAEDTGSRLVTIRPGEVFGKSKRGNVTRPVREMVKRKSALRLKPDQVKAGIYIEELVSMIH